MTFAPPNSPAPTRRFKTRPIVMLAAFAIAAAYTIFVLVHRYQSNRAFERQAAQQAAQQRRVDDRAAIEQLGGSEVAIRAFYASPTSIHRGETAQLCYDVANAKTVTLDPPAGEVWPSHARCLDVSPSKTTTYTLTIAAPSGPTVSHSVRVTVR